MTVFLCKPFAPDVYQKSVPAGKDSNACTMHRTSRDANPQGSQIRSAPPHSARRENPYIGPRNLHGILPAFLQNDFIPGSSLVKVRADSPVLFVLDKFLPATGPVIIR